jgi:hypothetical protein
VALAAQVHPDGFQVALVGLGGRIVAASDQILTIADDPERALALVAEAGARGAPPPPSSSGSAWDWPT